MSLLPKLIESIPKIVQAAEKVASTHAAVDFLSLTAGKAYSQPKPIVTALKELQEALMSHGESDAVRHLPGAIRGLQGTKVSQLVKELKVVRYLGYGGDSFAVQIDDPAVLKLGTQVKREVANPSFDAPVWNSGKLKTGVQFHMQTLGDTAAVTDDHYVQVIRAIREQNYFEQDIWGGDRYHRFRRGQVALFGENKAPMLIDQGCALPNYGFKYKAGELVPDALQSQNLIAIKGFLSDSSITISPTDITKPPVEFKNYVIHPTQRISDFELGEALRHHMQSRNYRPSMRSIWDPDDPKKWEHEEIELALHSLRLKSGGS